MSQTCDLIDVVSAIRSASTLTEATFLRIGQALEASIEILAKLTSSFEAVLTDLQGETLGQALRTLSGTAGRVKELGQNRSRDSTGFDRLRCLTESIGGRIAQMKRSLKDVEALAVNSKIAAATISVSGTDFTTFADDIRRMLDVTRATLDHFGVELRIVEQHVAAARSGQLVFETRERQAALSITERLASTVKTIALQHQRAARASHEVRLGSVRIRQRICNAILALQIGDITRQRLEHADYALGLVADTQGRTTGPDSNSVSGLPLLDEDEQRTFIGAVHRLQSAHLSDAAQHFDQEARRITESLNSLAAEAKALRNLGDSAYGSADHGGGSFIADLESQVGEALALFEEFETARAELAGVTATVSDATTSLRGHLRKVQSIETDIRIMALNTTFKCARVGREGLALSVIAQELRTYANGFAKEAGVLMHEVENVAGITGVLLSGTETNQTSLASEGTRAMREALVTLRQSGGTLDVAMADLERDSDVVVTLLLKSAGDLDAQMEIGQALRGAAGNLAGRPPSGFLTFANLAPRVEQMLELMVRGYTMATERTLHDRILGRPAQPARSPVTAPATELEDFLF